MRPAAAEWNSVYRPREIVTQIEILVANKERCFSNRLEKLSKKKLQEFPQSLKGRKCVAHGSDIKESCQCSSSLPLFLPLAREAETLAIKEKKQQDWLSPIPIPWVEGTDLAGKQQKKGGIILFHGTP
jgi:hypothetical protein